MPPASQDPASAGAPLNTPASLPGADAPEPARPLASPSTLSLPVVLPALVVLGALLLFCAIAPEAADAMFSGAQQWVVSRFDWFYVSAVSAFLVILVLLAASRYGDIRLGPDDAKPEFSFVSWSAMLFAAGMGIGLMYFGVVVAQNGEGVQFGWDERATSLRPPIEPDLPAEADYLTEIHPQGEAFVATLADRITRGAVLLIDYGFGEDEYYHPQRHMGTLVCHHQHQVDSDPLVLLGLKDITAHVNFTGIAVAAQDAGMEVLGYTTQGHFLINCGLAQQLEGLDVIQRSKAAKLMMEHEMGELFKVIALAKGVAPWEPVGFVRGDRMHRL